MKTGDRLLPLKHFIAYAGSLALFAGCAGPAAKQKDDVARLHARSSRPVLRRAAVANENVDDWRGEDFEHSLAYVLRAMNFIALGRRDEALVEAKRAELFPPGYARRACGFPRGRSRFERGASTAAERASTTTSGPSRAGAANAGG